MISLIIFGNIKSVANLVLMEVLTIILGTIELIFNRGCLCKRLCENEDTLMLNDLKHHSLTMSLKVILIYMILVYLYYTCYVFRTIIQACFVSVMALSLFLIYTDRKYTSDKNDVSTCTTRQYKLLKLEKTLCRAVCKEYILTVLLFQTILFFSTI
jgi:hypothetical protein